MRKIIPYRNSPILQYAFTALMVFLCSSHFYAQENHSHDKWEKNISSIIQINLILKNIKRYFQMIFKTRSAL